MFKVLQKSEKEKSHGLNCNPTWSREEKERRKEKTLKRRRKKIWRWKKKISLVNLVVNKKKTPSNVD